MTTSTARLLQKAWTISQTTSSAIVAGDTTYVGCQSPSGQDVICALDSATGRVLHRFGPPGGFAKGAGPRLAITGTTVVAIDAAENVSAYNAKTGRELWTHASTHAKAGQVAFASVPLTDSGLVLYAESWWTHTTTGTSAMALDLGTGRQLSDKVCGLRPEGARDCRRWRCRRSLRRLRGVSGQI